jgi:outer membrane receptor protein involved in Fe transport
MRYLYENVMLNFRYTTNVDIGDPRLQPEKTVSYEIGWEHLFTDDLRFNVTGYYKDITNLVGATDYVIPGSPSTYQAYVNMDYANVRGIEVQMETMGGSWIGGMLNYTWAWANGRSSTVFRSNGEIVPRRLDPLDWDIRHKINANLLMRSSGFVQDLIGDAELNFSITAQSGSPYTTNTRQVFPLFVLRNDGRLPWTSNVDARFRKSFRMANVEFSVLAEARNLLNAKNVQYISGGSDGILIWQASHNTDPTGPYNDPQAFGPPRTFRLGFQIQY